MILTALVLVENELQDMMDIVMIVLWKMVPLPTVNKNNDFIFLNKPQCNVDIVL